MIFVLGWDVKKNANIEFAIFIGEEYLISDRASVDIGINTGLWLSVSHLMQSSDCVLYIQCKIYT